DAALLHHRKLLFGRALAAGYDRAGVAHALARRRRDAGDKTDHRFFHVGLDPARAFFLVRAADLADHDHRFGLRVIIEHFHHIDVLQAIDRIAADADAGRLAETYFHRLTDRLVSQRAGTRYHADRAFFV